MFPYYRPFPYPYYPYYPAAYGPYAYGAGAAASPFDGALQSTKTMEATLYAIEPKAKFGHTEYTDAVTAYQQAGQYGVDTIAPAIDAAGFPNVTQPYTHKAWDMNSQLHNDIRTWGPIGPGFLEVQKARTLAWHMLVAYRQAIIDGQAALGQQGPALARAPVPQHAPRPPSAPLQAAAQNLLAAIHAASQAGEPVRWSRARGQSQRLWKPTADFQMAYNKATGGNLKVDGVFGKDTTAALQQSAGTNQVMSAAQMAVSGYR